MRKDWFGRLLCAIGLHKRSMESVFGREFSGRCYREGCGKKFAMRWFD